MPIGACALEQLDCLERRDVHQMRTGAEVGEIVLTVKADLLAACRVLIDQLELVRLVLHQLARLRRVKLEAVKLHA